jgi:hypothetical protein
MDIRKDLVNALSKQIYKGDAKIVQSILLSSSSSGQGYSVVRRTTLNRASIFPAYADQRRALQRGGEIDPDRWKDSTIRDRHPSAYVPFAAAPLECPGSHLALHEVRVALVSLVAK